MGFDQVKGWLRKLLIRIALVFAGGMVLAVAVSVNMNAGHAILAGLLSPDSPGAIVISIARILVPVVGLGLIYRGLI